MLKHLQIRNFRVFNELKIDRLSRINLIAGRNNSGKTSLLEAIFLLSGAGNAQMAINQNVIRGLAPDNRVSAAVVVEPSGTSSSLIWTWGGPLKSRGIIRRIVNWL